MADITTIKLEKETKSRLSRLKEHENETFDEVIKKMLYILNTARKNPETAGKILNHIDVSIKRKQGYTESEPKKEDSIPKEAPRILQKRNHVQNKK